MATQVAMAGVDAPATAAVVREFFLRHETVVVREGGQRLARLSGEKAGYALNCETGKLVCHFWSTDANLVRRVVGVEGGSGERLRLRCLRLGQSHASTLVLEAVEAGEAAGSARDEFRQCVIAAAEREWHGWRHEPAGEGPRGGVQRLLFRRQHQILPCVAVAEEESPAAAGAALGQALLWTEQVRKRWPRGVVAAIRLVLPAGAVETVRLRRRWLCPEPRIECFQLDRSAGQLNRVALSDSGNLDSRLRRAIHPNEEAAPAALLEEARDFCPLANWEWSADGTGRLCVHGLEVARQARGSEALAAPFYFGCRREQSPLVEATRPLFQQLLAAVAAQRVAGGDRRHPLYAMQPERWMEQLLRCDLGCLDPQVDPRFVYAQVPMGTGTCTEGTHRDVADLLALDRDGRLLVLELKADEDFDFPLQALDYWVRARRHLLEGDFSRLGYFPGALLSPLPPRLWLVAPALRWHPQTNLLGRWIAPEVPWTRFGLNEEWRHGIQVVYRKEAHHA